MVRKSSFLQPTEASRQRQRSRQPRNVEKRFVFKTDKDVDADDIEKQEKKVAMVKIASDIRICRKCRINKVDDMDTNMCVECECGVLIAASHELLSEIALSKIQRRKSNMPKLENPVTDTSYDDVVIAPKLFREGISVKLEAVHDTSYTGTKSDIYPAAYKKSTDKFIKKATLEENGYTQSKRSYGPQDITLDAKNDFVDDKGMDMLDWAFQDANRDGMGRDNSKENSCHLSYLAKYLGGVALDAIDIDYTFNPDVEEYLGRFNI